MTALVTGSYPFLHAVTNHWVEIADADTAHDVAT